MGRSRTTLQVIDRIHSYFWSAVEDKRIPRNIWDAFLTSRRYAGYSQQRAAELTRLGGEGNPWLPRWVYRPGPGRKGKPGREVGTVQLLPFTEHVCECGHVHPWIVSTANLVIPIPGTPAAHPTKRTYAIWEPTVFASAVEEGKSNLSAKPKGKVDARRRRRTPQAERTRNR